MSSTSNVTCSGVRLGSQLNGEVQDADLRDLRSGRPEARRHPAAAIGRARAVDPVEQLEEALSRQVGKGFADGLADPVVASEKSSVRVVDELDAMLGSAHDDHEARCLGEDLALANDLFVPKLGGKNGRRRFGANDQDAADAIDCARIVHGAVAVRPVHVLELAVTGDRHELVLVPDGAIPAHHLRELRANDSEPSVKRRRRGVRSRQSGTQAARFRRRRVERAAGLSRNGARDFAANRRLCLLPACGFVLRTKRCGRHRFSPHLGLSHE